MFKKLTSLFDRFSIGYGKPTAEQLHAMAAKGYSPYTMNMLAHNIPIQYYQSKDDQMEAYLSIDTLLGTPKHVRFNTHYMDNKNPIKQYSQLMVLEHEAVHWEQARYNPVLSSPLYSRPQDFYKHRRIIELEAYGRHAYKFVTDYINGVVPDEGLDYIINMNKFAVPVILDVWTGGSVKRDHDTMVNTLMQVKAEQNLKPVTAILPHFMYEGSQYANIKDDHFLTAAKAQKNAFALFEQSAEDILAKKIAVESDAIFSVPFGPLEAINMIHRDGHDHLGRLSGPEREQFWLNICHLTADHREHLEYQQYLAAHLREVHLGV